jgi:hypothetical protein
MLTGSDRFILILEWPMKFESLFTEYDDSLFGESYIDPLGQLVIWSAFGQKIFKNRVNSVSNDVRNFTLNLLHHAVIRSIMQDESVSVPRALAAEVGEKESLTFIHACLIYLENIFTYAMVDEPEKAGIDTLGILGGSNGRKQMEEAGLNPTLLFTQRAKAHLLVRQLGLGVSGRYKTPFVEMGFFDDSYRYFHGEAPERWALFETFLDKHEGLAQCFREARGHIIDLVSSTQLKGQVPPARQFRDVPLSLREAYRKGFATSGKVGAETKHFWMQVTGLNSGAAGALLDVLETFHAEEASQKLRPQSAFAAAECEEPEEQRKLEHIEIVEPLLAEVDLLFRIARYKKLLPMAEVRAHWQSLGRSDSTLPDAGNHIRDNSDLLEVLQGTSRRRLQRLLDVAGRETVEEQLTELLKYHSSVMRERGQLRWVELLGTGEVRVYGRTQALPDANKRPVYSWVNSYYIHQFYNLVTGYQGGAR